ncbi:MAG: putative DNA-binding domain-containing protein, partial [Myxococcota bacterium]
MSESLDTFFAQMESFLLGRTDVQAVQSTLGPSASGSDNLAFYRTLIDRNFHKALRLLFPSVKVLAGRVRSSLWSELVRDYVAAHPPRGCRDPNRMGASFSDFLTLRREQTGEFSPLLEEMAEYHWIDYLATTATDIADGDGFEKRLFIRQFSHQIPDFMRAVTADPDAPEPPSQPMIVILYRSLVDGSVKILHPRPETMAVIATRQGLPLPPP